MRQKHVLTALAIFAVTGAVNHSQSLAGAWWMDGIQTLADPKPWIGHRLMDQGQLEGDPLIHTVGDIVEGGDTMGRPRISPSDMYVNEHQTRQSEHGARQDTQSDHKTYSEFGSSNNPFQKESPGSLTAPFRETIYGQSPATPSADPSVRDLSRD